MRNLIIIFFISVLATGCGDDPLCAKKNLLISQVAEGISKLARGTATSSDLLKTQVASKEMSEVADQLNIKNITCKNP
jgi:hypothetical protein